MSDIEQKIFDYINSSIVSNGYEIVAVEYKNKNAGMNLTVFIDKEGGGIDFNDCEVVNNIVDPLLEELDPSFGQPYTLNVSSPGLDRKFVTQRDFERNYNREVELKLIKQYKKKYILEGILLNKSADTITIKIKDESVVIDSGTVQWVRPMVRFK